MKGVQRAGGQLEGRKDLWLFKRPCPSALVSRSHPTLPPVRVSYTLKTAQSAHPGVPHFCHEQR